MAGNSSTILVVDDEMLNRTLLATSLEEMGHGVELAADGQEALDLVRARPIDLVLLDLLMPEVDGYHVLETMKGDEVLQHIPVIVISAVDEMESILRCIRIGAADYLPKPFDPELLHARLTSSLASKRLRDLELEYLEQVGRVMDAAARVEDDTFELASLDLVSQREDALGQLARVFQKMAQEVRLREERLKRQVRDLRIEIDTTRQAKKVAEITESDYFKSLSSQVDDLRKIMDQDENP
jgi:CheY-like chemotaxis protein